MQRQAIRKAEQSLLFFVTLLLIAGLTLVFLARMRLGAPSDAININTASSDQIAYAFKIDPYLSRRIVAVRDKIGGFDSVNQLAKIPLFPASECQTINSILRAANIDWRTAPQSKILKALSVSNAAIHQLIAERGSISPTADISHVKLLTPGQWLTMRNRLYVRTPFQVFWSFFLDSIVLLCIQYFPLLLYKKLKMEVDPYPLPVAWLLSGLGVILLFSLKDPIRDTPAYIHQTVILCFALVVMMLVSLLSTPTRRRMRRYSNWWGAGFFACGLLIRFMDGDSIGGRIVFQHFHPTILYFLLFTLFIVSHLSSHPELYAEATRRWRIPNANGDKHSISSLIRFQREDIAPSILGAICILFTYVVMRDIASTAIICILFVSIYFLTTGRPGVISLGIGITLLICVFGTLLHVGDMQSRVGMWFHPWSNPFRNGAQLGQGYWALSSGGVFGTGLGMGLSDKIPLAGTDMMFAAIGEELGLWGTLSILILYAIIVQRGLRIALHIQNDFDRLLTGGLSVLLFGQVLLIVAGVTGLFPLAGLNLPFVSYGASALLPDFIIIGVLIGVSAKSAHQPIEDSHPILREAHGKYSVAVWIALIVLIGIGRLFWIQLARADWYATQKISTPDADGIVRAKTNPRILYVRKDIPRGTIYDRYGRALATSNLNEIVKALGDDLTSGFIYYKRGRYYPGAGAMVFPVGCVQNALTPSSGAEKTYDRQLRGYQRDSDLIGYYRRRNLPDWLFGGAPTGQNVTLTLDSALQERCVEILQKDFGSQSLAGKGIPLQASLVMMNPLTGEIIVSCSLPGYDPNRLLALSSKWGSDKAESAISLLNSLHYGTDQTQIAQFEPGNAFEPFVASAALQAGVHPKFRCNHTITDLTWMNEGVTYHLPSLFDIAGASPHGLIGMKRALSVSCRVYFARLSIGVGAKDLRRILAEPAGFGFQHIAPDTRFNSNLPLEANGIGLTRVSPLEMADAMCTIANQGVRMKPILLKSIARQGQSPYFTHTFIPLSNPLSSQIAKQTGDMLRFAQQKEADALGLKPSGYHVAAKIASVQGMDGKWWTWYVGYAPQRRPVLAFACIVRGGGGRTRLAVVKAIRQILRERFGK